MNFDEPQSTRLKMLLAKSAEYRATTEAKLNCLSDAYQEIAGKALIAIEAIEDDARRGLLAKDFASALDRHLGIMEEFTCVGASEPLVISGTQPFSDPSSV